jgi:hypothetical protein
VVSSFTGQRRFRKLARWLLVAPVAMLWMLTADSSAEERPAPDIKPDLASLDLSCPGCNIILLNIELLRADYVGIGDPTSQRSHTPNIDAFFDGSLVFEDVSAPAGESYRSNLSVQTAMRAFHYRAPETAIHDFIGDSRDSRYTETSRRIAAMLTRYPAMAEFFQAAGYHTISMNQGIRAGRYLLLDRGFHELANWSRRTTSFRTTVEDFVAALKAQKSRPFLVHYRPEVLHPFPYYYPESRLRIEDPGKIFSFHRPRYNRYSIRFRPSLPEQEKRKVHHRIYAQQVRYMDDELGEALKAIKEGGLEENSIIVLYANHGSGLGDNGVHKLAVSYQSCIHVPLLIKHPRIDQEIRVDAPVSLIDLVPTLMDMVGLESPAHFEGASLLRDLRNGESRPYFAGRNDFDEYIRKGALKLIVRNSEFLELYNVEEDPHEQRDLKQLLPMEARAMKTALDAIKLSILRKVAEPAVLSE